MGESTSVKRQVKPWVAVVAIGAAVVVFGGIWLMVGNRRLDRESGRTGGRARHGRAWVRATGMCRRLNMAGNSYAIQGMYDSALACYREVLRISQEQGLTDRMAAAYANMSNVFDYLHMPESVRFYMSAATALDQLSKKPGKVMGSLFAQGTFRFTALGDYDSATVLLEKAAAESRSKNDSLGEVEALCNLGYIQATLEHYDSARVMLESCAVKYRALRNASGEASVLHSLGVIYLKRDRLGDAKKWLLKAIEVAHNGDIIGEEAPALYELALIRADQDEFELAQVNVEQALKLYERAGDRDGISRCRDCRDALIQAQRWKQRSKALDSIFEEYRQKSSTNPGI